MRHKKPGHSNGHNNHQKRNHNHNGGGHNRGKFNPGRSHGADDARVRKNATAAREKYLQLAKDAMSSGDRVQSEYYLQHADHYYRILSALPPEEVQRKVVPINSEVALETPDAAEAGAVATQSQETAPVAPVVAQEEENRSDNPL